LCTLRNTTAHCSGWGCRRLRSCRAHGGTRTAPPPEPMVLTSTMQAHSGAVKCSLVPCTAVKCNAWRVKLHCTARRGKARHKARLKARHGKAQGVRHAARHGTAGVTGRAVSIRAHGWAWLGLAWQAHRKTTKATRRSRPVPAAVLSTNCTRSMPAQLVVKAEADGTKLGAVMAHLAARAERGVCTRGYCSEPDAMTQCSYDESSASHVGR
jgi:hypothetical protein